MGESQMIQRVKPPGTLLFGKAMLAQFSHQLFLAGAKNPVMITTRNYRRKAMQAARVISSGLPETIPVLVSTPGTAAEIPKAPWDFILIAGTEALVDSFSPDPRPKAWILLEDQNLEDFKCPLTELLVADSLFIRDRKKLRRFFQSFGGSLSPGQTEPTGVLTIPKAFTYSCRTAMITGENSLEILPELLKERGVRNPMVLTDKGIRAAGILDRLTVFLTEKHFSIYDDIPPDSSSRTVNAISREYKKKRCDGIIALGGGSVLDTGKGVYLNVSLGETDLTALAGSNRIPGLTTPFIAIPTTSGTGSEATKVAVISDAVRGRKILYVSPNLMPDFGILDPGLTASLPPGLTSITGMDALSHAVEAYTCLGKNPISDQIARQAIELIRDSLIPVMTDPENLTLRGNLALASNLAGQAFSNSMVGMIHTIGHSVGAVCRAPHGSCMAVLMPASLEYNTPMIKPLLKELLPALIGQKEAAEIPEDQKPPAAIEAIRTMNRRLRELTGGRHPEKLNHILDREGKQLISPEDFSQIAETALGDASIVYNPRELRKRDIMAVLEKSF